MKMGYVHTAKSVHVPKGRLSAGLYRFKSLFGRYARPATPGRPLGVHLPDRVWRRQSALLMCLRDSQFDERS